MIIVNMAGNTISGSRNSSFGGHLVTGSIPDFNWEDVLAVGDGSFDNPLGCLVEIHLVDHGVAGEEDQRREVKCSVVHQITLNIESLHI